MMIHVKASSLTTFYNLLVKFGELPLELHALKLTIGFQQWLAHVSPSWLVSKATSLSKHLVGHGLTPGTN